MEIFCCHKNSYIRSANAGPICIRTGEYAQITQSDMTLCHNTIACRVPALFLSEGVSESENAGTKFCVLIKAVCSLPQTKKELGTKQNPTKSKLGALFNSFIIPAFYEEKFKPEETIS